MEILIVMVLVLVVLYVVTIRPQRQRQLAVQTMIDRAGVGDDILTNGGIYGTIVETDEDDIVVEIADGLNVHMTRRGIAAVLPPEDEEDVEEGFDGDEATDEDDAEPMAAGTSADELSDTEDEAPVSADEDAVRSEGDVDPASADRR